MSRMRPLSPLTQRRLASPDEQLTLEGLVAFIAEAISTGPNGEANRKDPQAHPKSLAALILQLQHFMDEHLGAHSTPAQRFMTKIPAVLFRDFSDVNGGLRHILEWSLEFRRQALMADGNSNNTTTGVVGLRRFELQSEKSRPFATDLCMHLGRRLIEEGLWKLPRVFIDDEANFPEVRKIKDIITRHQGTLVSTPEEASHIVVPQSVVDEADDEYYYRTLDSRGNKVLVHWWFHPDSYDSWVNSNSSGASPPRAVEGSPSAISGAAVAGMGDNGEETKWRVGLEWVTLLDKYNEWMNEIDFDVTAPSEDGRTGCKEEVNDESGLKMKLSSRGGLPRGRRTRNQRLSAEGEEPRDTRSTAPLKGAPSPTPEKLEPLTDQETKNFNTPDIGLKRKRGRPPTRNSIDAAGGGGAGGNAALRRRSRVSSIGGGSEEIGNDSSVLVRFRVTGGHRGQVLDVERSQCRVVAVYPPNLLDIASAEGSSGGGAGGFDLKLTPRVSNGGGRDSPLSVDRVVGAGRVASRIGARGSTKRRRPQVSDYADSGISKSLYSRGSGYMHDEGLNNFNSNDDASSVLSSGGQTAAAAEGGGTTIANRLGPNVTQQPSRSLQHSIIASIKEGPFRAVSNMNPWDPELNSFLLQTDPRDLMAAFQASSRSGGSVHHAVGSPHIKTTSQGDVPDVPPLTNDKEAFSSWTVPSLHHLSDMERRELEQNSGEIESLGVCGEMDNGLTETGLPIVLPTNARWFDYNAVHPIEKEQLGSIFFGVSSRSESLNDIQNQYKEIRNAIIKVYRTHPRRYLSVSACRRFIEGDAAQLLRVHSFLDFWGLINFQASPQTLPSRDRRPADFRLTDPKYPGGPWLTSPRHLEVSAPVAAAREATEQEGDGLPRNPTGCAKCVACGRLCLYSYFVLRPGLTPGVSVGLIHRSCWCPSCFVNGRFPDVLHQRQFMKVSIPLVGARSGRPDEWTEGEMERLIEGIETYHENWDSVAKHVGTRTAEECVSHFIQLPLDEPNLELFEEEDKHLKNPLTDFANPLMAELALLNAVLGPEVAAEAAKAACGYLVNTLVPKINEREERKQDVLEGHPSQTEIATNEIDMTLTEERSSNYPEQQASLDNLSKSVPQDDLVLQEKSPEVAEDDILPLLKGSPTAASVCDDALYLTEGPGDESGSPLVSAVEQTLQRPVDPQHVSVASKHAMKAAAEWAKRQAKEQEAEARILLERINTLREKRLEDKIMQFYRNEDSIAACKLHLKEKLEGLQGLRKQVQKSLNAAGEENQRVVAGYQHERNQQMQEFLLRQQQQLQR